MKKLFIALCAATIGLGSVAATTVPATAAPLLLKPSVEQSSDVQNVQERRWRERGDRRWRGDRDWRGDRGWRGDGRRGYYNGHRGYRDYRPGYRRHGDFWFPAGAFIAGAIIGGALSDPAPRYYEPPRRIYREQPRVIGRGGSSHTQWCYNRYRSYRAYDNTFQPYEGPRQQCYSPY